MKSDDLKSKVFNLTIAGYEIPFVPYFYPVDGEWRFAVKDIEDFWSRYAKFTRTRLKIKLAKKGQWGTWKEGVGYTDGIYGMLQNKEASKLFFRVPITLQDPPGVFTAPFFEDTYNILTQDPDELVTTQDLFLNVLILEPLCWLSYFALLFIIDCFCVTIGSGLRGKSDGLISRASSIIFRVVQDIFKQDSTTRKARSLMILSGLLVTLYTAIYGAAYNTNAIVGANIDRVETLLDIVKLNKVPLFAEGESMHELFASKTGPEFSAVYRYAKKIDSEKSVPLDYEQLKLHLSGPSCFDVAVLASGTMIYVINNAVEGLCAVSNRQSIRGFVSKPYHKTIRMEIISPIGDGPEADELVKRDKTFSNQYFESGLGSKFVLNSVDIIREYINQAVSFEYGFDEDIYKNQKINKWREINLISPLSLSNFALVFQIMFTSYFIALLINFFLYIYSSFDKL